MTNKIIKDKVKVLLLGAAFSADLHMDGYARIKDKVEIVAIVDKDESKIHDLAKRYGFEGYKVYTDFEKAIEEVECDLVDICLPNFLHYAPAIQALEKGRDIICEKPLATTVEDAEEMVNTAKEMGKHIYYAEDWLFAPAINKALKLIEEGGIGKPLYLRARECHSGSHSPFAQTIKACGGGSMIHLGIHAVVLALAMNNNEWTELIAMTSGGGEDNLVHKTMEGEDCATVMMKFKNGTMATLEGNYITVGGMEDSISVYGTEGCMHIDLTFSSPISCYSIPGLEYTIEKAEVTTGWSRPAVDEKYNIGYVAEIDYFIDCCRKGIDAEIGMRGVDGLEALKVVNYIYESERKGIRIKNPNMEG